MKGDNLCVDKVIHEVRLQYRAKLVHHIEK